MGNLDDLKDELEYALAKQYSRSRDGLGMIIDREVRDAIEYGWIQLDAGASYGEALAAARNLLKVAV